MCVQFRGVDIMFLEVDETNVKMAVSKIKKEKELNVLVDYYIEFISKYTCHPNREIYPYPKRTDIIDEDKSVKWNREEVQRLRSAYEDKVKELNNCKNTIDNALRKRIIELLAKDNDISVKESSKIWSYAYAEGHSNGVYNVIACYREFIEIYTDLLEIRKEQ